MHWCWSRNRSVGGKMLKIIISILFFTFSLSAFACWRFEGKLAVDGETFKVDQKIVHDKSYSFPMGNWIMTLSVHAKKDSKINVVKYQIQEKKGTTLTLVTQGEEEVKDGVEEDVFAKGEEGQPNTIITLKLKHI